MDAWLWEVVFRGWVGGARGAAARARAARAGGGALWGRAWGGRETRPLSL